MLVWKTIEEISSLKSKLFRKRIHHISNCKGEGPAALGTNLPELTSQANPCPLQITTPLTGLILLQSKPLWGQIKFFITESLYFSSSSRSHFGLLYVPNWRFHFHTFLATLYSLKVPLLFVIVNRLSISE